MAISVRRRQKPADFDPDTTILIPPDPYIQAVRTTLGVIDLDPCSSSVAQKIIEAQGWYKANEAEAALAQPWSGRVFLHPHPHSSIARRQLQKLLRDYLSDRVEAAVILANKIDWLRSEPLLLSFPFLFHYRRQAYYRCLPGSHELVNFNPSFNSFTLYLPAKEGATHFDDVALDRFTHAFSPIGRIVLAEDLGEDWGQHALRATQRMRMQPVLPVAQLDRY